MKKIIVTELTCPVSTCPLGKVINNVLESWDRLIEGSFENAIKEFNYLTDEPKNKNNIEWKKLRSKFILDFKNLVKKHADKLK